jgi:hypothetical protein
MGELVTQAQCCICCYQIDPVCNTGHARNVINPCHLATEDGISASEYAGHFAGFSRRGMIFSGRLGRWPKLPIHISMSDQSEVCMSIFICKHVLVVDSTCYCFDLVYWHNRKCFHMLKNFFFLHTIGVNYQYRIRIWRRSHFFPLLPPLEIGLEILAGWLVRVWSELTRNVF